MNSISRYPGIAYKGSAAGWKWLASVAIILAAACTWSSHLAAFPGGSQIKGKVRDQSGGAISGAAVRLTAGTFSATQVTGRDGQFDFTDVPASSGAITIKAQGFADAKQEWFPHGGGAIELEFVLTPAAISERVNVTAARTQLRLGETPASVVILSAPDLAATAALTLDDSLRQVPGFTLFRRSGSRTANPTSQGFSLRGVGASGASRGLALVEGVPLNDPFGGWVYWDRVPRESVSEVEILSGAASDLYGTDAMGGVVNVRERHSDDSSFGLETSYGNENTPEVSLDASARLGDWIAGVSGEAFHTDGYILVDDAERGAVDTRAGSEYYTSDLNLGRVISDRARAFVRGSIFGESRQNGTPLTPNRTHLRQLAAGFDFQSNGWGAIAGRAYGGPQLLDQNFSSVAADRNSEALTRIQRVPVRALGGTAQWSRPLGSHQTWVAGLEAGEVRGASDEFAITKGAATSAVDAGGRERKEGWFAEDIFRPNSRWLLTAGGRLDHWRNYSALGVTRPLSKPGPPAVTDFPDRAETAFSPRLAALFRASDHLSLTASGYQAFRAPTLNELYRSFRVGNVLTTANANLLAEHLTGGEAGARYDLGARQGAPAVEFRGTFFWSEISRPIANVTLSSSPTLITRQRQNLGRIRSRGFELDAVAHPAPYCDLSAGYQFVNALVLSFPAASALVGLRVPQVPQNEVTFQARYANPRRITAALEGRFGGAQFDDDLNQFLLGRYFTLDAIVSRPLGHGVEVFVAGENVFDRRYAVGRTPVETLGPPALARVGLRVEIGRH